jgi:phosphoadenosine phosphosulfate reductase
MSELKERVQASIERLKAFEPRNGEGYYLAFSGGKDSVVCKALLDMAGVKYESTYRVTSVDPPELVQFIKNEHPDVKREIPHYKNITYKDGRLMPITMWNLIPRKLMPPTRLVRYCCSELKESGGDGRMTVTGVRWAESVNRAKNQGKVTIVNAKKKDDVSNSPDFKQTNRGGVVLVNDNADSRRMVEQCYKRRKTTVNPIIDWSDREVWEFIRAESIPVCKLYGEGWNRLGCIGCPMARRQGREKEFARWPTYKKAYLTAFGKMLEERIKRGKIDGSWRMGTTAQDVFNWWMEYDVLPGQTSLFEDE